MIGGGWTRIVVIDLLRHWRHFAAASFGIILGVAALTFFLGLGLKARGLLLSQVFPQDHVEVVPKSADIDLFALRLNLGRDALDAVCRIGVDVGTVQLRPVRAAHIGRRVHRRLLVGLMEEAEQSATGSGEDAGPGLIDAHDADPAECVVVECHL